MLWTATILKKVESFRCPVCRGEEAALIPLCRDEKYEYSLEPGQGLQIKFSPLYQGIICKLKFLNC